MTTDLARTDDTQNTALANHEDATAAITHYLGTGDLSRLSGDQKAALYLDTCASLRINPRTRPFDWVEFWDPETKSKKLTLYPNKTCADQLAYQHQIRVRTVEEKIVGELFKVVVEGTLPNGRTETNVSYLDLTDRDGNRLRGQKLGNAFMKGHTKAKRRLVFGMLGMMAPPDVEELQRARIVTMDGRGNVLDNPTAEQKMLAESPAIAQVIGEPTFETTTTVEASPLAGTASQVAPAESEPLGDAEQAAAPSGPRPSFRASEEDVKRWCGAWFGAVKGLSLDTDAARHAFVQSWSRDELEWPEGKHTDSLRTMFARMTSQEAGDFLAYVRNLMEDEKRELLEQSHANMPDPEPPARPAVSQRVHDSVMVTGGPLTADDEPTAF